MPAEPLDAGHRPEPQPAFFANVYVTGWMAREGFDIVLAAGSLEEALAAYREASGRPGKITESAEQGDGAVWYLDQALGWQGFVTRYRTRITEVLPEPDISVKLPRRGLDE